MDSADAGWHAGKCDFCGRFAQVITVRGVLIGAEGTYICKRCVRELSKMEKERKGAKNNGQL